MAWNIAYLIFILLLQQDGCVPPSPLFQNNSFISCFFLHFIIGFISCLFIFRRINVRFGIKVDVCLKYKLKSQKLTISGSNQSKNSKWLKNSKLIWYSWYYASYRKTVWSGLNLLWYKYAEADTRIAGPVFEPGTSDMRHKHYHWATPLGYFIMALRCLKVSNYYERNKSLL